MSELASIRDEVQIPYGRGVLAGLLQTPPLPGPHPALILLAGSGPADRDVPYLLSLRNHLVRQGIATLVFDKPGVGGSSGDWRHQTFYDRVEQVSAARRFLQQRTNINAQQIGLYGISQGAWITLLAASSDPNIPFIIPVSGPGMIPIEQDVYYIEHMMRADGSSDVQVQQAKRYVQNVLDAARRNVPYSEVAARFVNAVQHEPWYHYYAIPDADMWEYFRRNAQIHYDPSAWLAQVKCPVLAIFGAEDLLLPVDKSAAVYQECLTKSGNMDVMIKIFPHAGHLLTVPPKDELAPGYLELIVDWLTQRVAIVQTDEPRGDSK